MSTGVSVAPAAVATGVALSLGNAEAELMISGEVVLRVSVAGGKSLAIGAIVIGGCVSAAVVVGGSTVIVTAIAVAEGSPVATGVDVGAGRLRVEIARRTAKSSANMRAANANSATTNSLPMSRCMAIPRLLASVASVKRGERRCLRRLYCRSTDLQHVRVQRLWQLSYQHRYR